MTAIESTSGRLHSEFVRILFLQAHRETDRFFAASGVQLAQQSRGVFHYRRVAFSNSLKAKTGSILDKASDLRLLNIDASARMWTTFAVICRKTSEELDGGLFVGE